MASSFSLIPFLALFLVSFSHIALSLSSKSFLPFHKPIISQKKFPVTMAEKFIRQLNLFPKHDINIISSKDNIALANDERLFEKKLNLPYLGDSGATVQDLGHHAGYFRLLHTKAARMFYFFFESRSNKNDPVVIWLTGGPGCSSELALFYENGPFKLSDNMSLVWNDFGWDKVSNLIYVDQPTGTGFSYSTVDSDIRNSETGVSNDLYDFLQEFFKAHPDYVNNDFYITGESYAGHYIPAFASRVNQGNKNKEGININLKGFAIGNGLTNPEIQYKAYTDYALDMKLINQTDYDAINQLYPQCQQEIRLCGSGSDDACLDAFGRCTNIFSSIMDVVGDKNYYDIRKKCEGNLCYDFSGMETYLNDDQVKQALGVPNSIDFVSCSSTVYQAMETDWMKNLEEGIPSLLEDGINLLIYAGEYDLICNWLGNSNWVHAVEWSGQNDFVAAPSVSFTVDGEEKGIQKSYGPLTFLKVHDAGHMVPMDQPKAALEMLQRWTTQGKLS
ncbi:PREDICTED: serine carboxypeptidase-like [Nicotiana attenuata]|uniref:Carboxypeptidase n=1 Tax=Nicotiana attenuata TaxID=49451 RepID=A0A1J6KN66_NICAT|nr:PREDICTED: serine carboxypeptidase-like [Nicotiana attenuata]OIT23151.1 serine carboxypeptidase-like 48 [Nicotiana attenuata]